MDTKPHYISLQEAARECGYSQEYLSLRARQGKLKAVKPGRNWVTTKEWLDEYIHQTDSYKQQLEVRQSRKQRRASFFIDPPDNLPVGEFHPAFLALRMAVVEKEEGDMPPVVWHAREDGFSARMAQALVAVLVFGVFFVSGGVFASVPWERYDPSVPGQVVRAGTAVSGAASQSAEGTRFMAQGVYDFGEGARMGMEYVLSGAIDTRTLGAAVSGTNQDFSFFDVAVRTGEAVARLFGHMRGE